MRWLLALAAWPLVALAEPVVPTITTSGEATLTAPADRVTIDIGVVTTAADAGQAMDENTQRMEGVLAAIVRLGIDRDDIETRGFAVQPRWSNAPGRHEPRITGFSVTNRVVVRTTQLDLAGKILAAATDAGANSIGNLRFDLADSSALRRQALAAATRNALADAETLATAAKLNLGKVVSLTTGYTAPVGPQPAIEQMVAMARDAGPPPPIRAGEVSVRASVTARIEIARP